MSVRRGISGTPTVPGVYNVSVSATNSLGTVQGSISFTVANFPPAITSAATATTRIGVPFTYTITALYLPTAYSVSGLPTGFTFNAATGTISGSAQVSGIVTMTLSATNSGGTGTATLQLTVLPPPPVVTSATAASATLNVPFTYALTASGRVDS